MKRFRITKCLGLKGNTFVAGQEEDYLHLMAKMNIDAENAVARLVERGACEYVDSAPAQVEDTDTVSMRAPAREGNLSLVDLMKKKKADLEAMLPEGLAVEGSGTDGSVLKEDIARALLSGG